MKKVIRHRLTWVIVVLALGVFLNTVFAEAAEKKQSADSGAMESNSTQSQKSDLSLPMERPNTFSLEILGRGGLYSFNYDRTLSDNFAVGAGISHYGISSGSANASVTMVPIYGNYYFSSGNHRLFVSAGPTLIMASGNLGDGSSTVKGGGIAGTLGGGYEYRSDGGFLFRAAPYVFLGNAQGVWLGLSVGYSI